MSTTIDRETESNGEPRRVAVLGASGSIGGSALDVIESSNGRLTAEVLSVHSDVAKLVELSRRFRPSCVVITGENADRSLLSEMPPGIEILFGSEALNSVVRRAEIDVVLVAIVGSAGLRVVWNALEAGKTVALANKESLVMGGSLVMNLSRQTGGQILPVDSEHSAIFQCLLSRRRDDRANGGDQDDRGDRGDRGDENRVEDSEIPFVSNRPRTWLANEEVERLVLTASGGPFWTWSRSELRRATVADALTHPTWKMGRKITIDSATMMNKALEIIEARWLFDVPSEKIQVVVHPESIVHSMVEFVDGAVIAQLSPPDMRLPIQLALLDGRRISGCARRFDWTRELTFHFMPPDLERFPAVSLGLEVAKSGGTAGVVVNAANEIAVEAFLNGRLSFDQITVACQTILANHQFELAPTFERLFELDAWARKETQKWISG